MHYVASSAAAQTPRNAATFAYLALMAVRQAQIFTPRMHAALVACAVAIALAGVALIPSAGNSWSWPLFLWGLLLGPLTVAWLNIQSEFPAIRLRAATGAELDPRTMRARRIQRYWSTYVGVLAVGFTVGAASASLTSAWIDLGFTAYVVFFGVLPLVFYPAIVARASALNHERNGTP